MLYKINNGSVSFGADTVLENINFEIKDKQKIAVVGRNGCGKTTLLKLISGEIDFTKRDSDEDVYLIKSGCDEIGYLKQIAFEDDSVSMQDEIKKVYKPLLKMKEDIEGLVKLLETDSTEENIKKYTELREHFELLGGYYYQKEYEAVIKNFGFTDEDKKKPLSEFSGGQRTKIAFIKLLLSKPDILLLDEPTNHLDVDAVEWLEGYLKSYKRAVVVVSHDRMFIDKIVDTVYEIEHRVTNKYNGNYSAYIEKKQLDFEKQQKEYSAQQKEIERLNQLVDRFKYKPTKASMAKSKLKQLEHMDLINAPQSFDMKSFHTNFQPDVETGNDVLSVNNLEIGYDKVLSCVSFNLHKGEKLGIIGGNGLGKSTFIKTLVGRIAPLSGSFSFGVNVKIGYFDQQMAQYKSDKPVLYEFWDEFPSLTQTEARNALGAFLFTGEDVFKQVNLLSGGERVRLALCKILKRKPNVLVLDEPTNHMDIVGKEALEEMLYNFSGTVIFVSHDRYFVNKISDKLLIFDKNDAVFYPYGYSEYVRQAVPVTVEIPEEKAEILNEEKTTNSYNRNKERAKRERKILKLEAEIAMKELEIEKTKSQLDLPEIASDYVKLTDIQQEICYKENELLEIMEEWESLKNTVD